MKFVNGLRALALSAFIFGSAGCTSDGSGDPIEAIESDNQVPQQGEESADVELPTAEAASVAAEQGIETIDQNSDTGVQALSSEQQIAVDEAAEAGFANGAGQEIAGIAAPRAEGDMIDEMPVASPASAATEVPLVPMAEVPMPDAPVIDDLPATSPDMPAETAPTIPALAETETPVAEASKQAQVTDTKVKKAKKSKSSKRSAKTAPTLSGNEKLYIVEKGDTLGKISSVLYGTSRRWKNIADLNNLENPSRIFPGDALKYVPSEKTASFEAKYDGLPKATVTVEKGDTLSKIATRVMGNASYWKMLWHWNQASLPDAHKLAAGMTLTYITAKDLESTNSSAAH